MNELLEKLAIIPLQNILGAGLVLGGLYYFMMYDDGSAIRGQIQQAQQTLEQERTKNADYKKTLEEKKRLESQLRDLGSKLIELSQKLPSELPTIELSKTIDQVAIETGVKIKSKKPGDSSKLDIVEEVPIEITLDGSYSELGTFIFKISKLDRVTRVKSFKIDVGEDKGAKKLRFEGTIAGYRMLEEKKK